MRILVVDDNQKDVERLCHWIEEWFSQQAVDSGRHLHEVTICSVGQQARAQLQKGEEEFALVFLSWDLGEINVGQELLMRHGKNVSGPHFIVMSRQFDVSISSLAFRLGARSFIGKPLDRKEVVSRLEDFFTPEAPISFLDELRSEIIGESPALMEMLRQVGRAILNPELSVLLIGETGTGKELVAQAIHRLSKPGKNIVSAALGSLPSELVADAIFGHDRGAFHGANHPRKGYLEEAGDGTLFLDEIGELPLKVQADLLRALEVRRFHRLGSAKETHFQARLVCATNRDLSTAVRKGLFREDFYHRINTFTIHVPPLRQRREDIPLLLQHFLTRYGSGRILSIDRIARLILESYDFPGNIRGLANVVAAAITNCDKNEILPHHLPLEQMSGHPTAEPSPQPEKSSVLTDSLSPPSSGPADFDGIQISVKRPWLNLSYHEAQEEVIRQFDAIYLRHKLHEHRYIKRAADAAKMDRKTFTQRAERAGLFSKTTANSSFDEHEEKEGLS